MKNGFMIEYKIEVKCPTPPPKKITHKFKKETMGFSVNNTLKYFRDQRKEDMIHLPCFY